MWQTASGSSLKMLRWHPALGNKSNGGPRGGEETAAESNRSFSWDRCSRIFSATFPSGSRRRRAGLETEPAGEPAAETERLFRAPGMSEGSSPPIAQEGGKNRASSPERRAFCLTPGCFRVAGLPKRKRRRAWRGNRNYGEVRAWNWLSVEGRRGPWLGE